MKLKKLTVTLPVGTLLIMLKWLQESGRPMSPRVNAALDLIRKRVYQCVEFDADDPRSIYNAESSDHQ